MSSLENALIRLSGMREMVYLYADESGDMGFDFTNSGTSHYFSIAFLLLREQRPIFSLVRKVFLTLPQATKRKSSGVLHAHHEKPSTINILLSRLALQDINIPGRMEY